MRAAVLVATLALGACGSGGGETAANNAATAAAPEGLAAGQWELTSEVTSFAATDGPAGIDTPVGTRATWNVCVEADRPPPAMFGGEGFDCQYRDYYGRNGRLGTTLNCRREGLNGDMSFNAQGRFGADELEFTQSISTFLAGQGDFNREARVTGRRTGECVAAAPAGNSAG